MKVSLNDQEKLEWGFKENELRQNDLAVVHSQAELEIAQEAAKQRRLLVGVNRGEAVRLVCDAQNELARRECLAAVPSRK